MAINSRRCRLYRHSAEFGEIAEYGKSTGLKLFGGLRAGFRNTWILLVQVFLEALLVVFHEARKFDTHAHAGVPGANGGGCGDAFLVDPEINPQGCRYCQRHDGLNITTVSANVCGIDAHGSIYAFVAEFQGERNFVTEKLSPVIWRSSRKR